MQLEKKLKLNIQEKVTLKRKNGKETHYKFHFRLLKGEYKIFIIKEGELDLMEYRTTNRCYLQKMKKTLPFQYLFILNILDLQCCANYCISLSFMPTSINVKRILLKTARLPGTPILRVQ